MIPITTKKLPVTVWPVTSRGPKMKQGTQSFRYLKPKLKKETTFVKFLKLKTKKLIPKVKMMTTTPTTVMTIPLLPKQTENKKKSNTGKICLM